MFSLSVLGSSVLREDQMPVGDHASCFDSLAIETHSLSTIDHLINGHRLHPLTVGEVSLGYKTSSS